MYLLLDHNEIAGLQELEILTALQSLRYLTVQGNPSAKVFGVRLFLVTKMPLLWALDNMIIVDAERKIFSVKSKTVLNLKRFLPLNTKFACESWPSLVQK